MCWVHGGEMVIVPASDIETLAVLFIADDPDLAEMYRLKLELDGYWVRVLDNPLDARLSAGNIGLIEVDVGSHAPGPRLRPPEVGRMLKSSKAKGRDGVDRTGK